MRLCLIVLALVGCNGDTTDGTTTTPQRWSEAFDAGGATALSGVSGNGPDDVYMVGGDATTGSIWHYDGSDWTLDTSAPATDLLVWVHAFGPDDVWIVGEGGAGLRGSAGSWEQLDPGTTEPLWGVWGTSPDDLWIVGGLPAENDPVILHWDGRVFTPHALDAEENDRAAQSLFKIWGIDGRVFAVGQRGLVIEYDTDTWRQMPSGAEGNQDFVSLWGTSATDIVIAGGRSSARISTFDGTSWTTTAPDRVPGLNAVSMLEPGLAVIGGANGWVGTYDVATGTTTGENVVDPTSDVHATWYDGAGTLYGAAGHFAEPYFGTALIRESDL
ncbi:MAG: hypothetical protein KTR31_18260 [Myxococcales bacterium]|nr:hypothetical protein [Myxococcales bacterium]